MPNHSPEPWQVQRVPPGHEEEVIETVGQLVMFEGETAQFSYHAVVIDNSDDFEYGPLLEACDKSQRTPNLHRIVACVNACAGLNPVAVPTLLAVCEAFVSDYFVPHSSKGGEVSQGTARMIRDVVLLAKAPPSVP